MLKIVSSYVPLPDLVELSAAFVSEKTANQFSIQASLHIRPEEIQISEDYTVKVMFKSAYVFVETDNMTTLPSSLYGLRVIKEHEEIIEYKRTAERSASNLKASNISMDVGHGSKDGIIAKLNSVFDTKKDKSARYIVEAKSQSETRYIPVEYFNSGKWKITPDIGAVYLNGTFLNETKLCAFTVNPGRPNSVGATIYVTVRPRDLEIELKGDILTDKNSLFSNQPNKKAVLNLLIKNHLEERCGSRNMDEISFAIIEAKQ